MAIKPPVLGGRRAIYALDNLSKSALTDILIDRVKAEIGEDATDEQVLAHIQPWIDTVLRLRGDRPLNLLGSLEKMARAEARYLERQEQEKVKQAERAKQEQAMKEKIDAYKAEELKKPLP